MAAKTLPDRDYIRECLDYDPITGTFRWRVRPVTHFQNAANHAMWNDQHHGKIAGWISHGYRIVTLDNSKYRLHRLAWLLTYGEPVPFIIDHIDRNPGNNCINNLRAASALQSSANTGGWSAGNSTGVKGVRLRKVSRKYEAYIMRNGAKFWLGCFDTLDEAAKARREAAERLQGEFAHLG